LEYWSVGVIAIGLMSFFNTSILHHPSTPGPKFSKTFGNLEIAFLKEEKWLRCVFSCIVEIRQERVTYFLR
jgi:hypothetical protein